MTPAAECCLSCGSPYVHDLNPATGFPWHYCQRCRKTRAAEQALAHSLRNGQKRAAQAARGALFPKDEPS